jgi:TPR repeat protein
VIGADPRTPEGIRAFEALCPSVVLDLNGANHDPKACEVAGRAYQQGKVVPRNVGRALELYRRGCWDQPRSPSHASCQALAQAFMNGDGVPPDPQRAVALFASHCGVYGGSSCLALADFLERVAPADETEADRERRERLRKIGQ